MTNGFLGHREINTVTYDPRLIRPEEMVAVLKKVHTYIGIAQR